MKRDDYRLKLFLNLLVVFSFIFIFSIVHATETVQNKEKDQYLFAKGLYEDGLDDLALKHLQIFLGNYPFSKHIPDVLYYVGNIYLSKKNNTEFLKYYKVLIDNYTSYARREKILIEYFNKNYQLGNYREALGSIEKIILEYPKSKFVTKSYRYKGEILLKLKEYQKLLDYYKDLLEKPETGLSKGELYYRIGEVNLKLNNIEEAKENFSLIGLRYPKDPFAEKGIYALGQLSYNLGDYEKAVEIFKDLIKKYPKSKESTSAKYSIIRFLYHSEKYEEGVKWSEKINRAKENHSQRLFQMARERIIDGEYLEGIRFYIELIEKYPKDNLAKESYWEIISASDLVGDYPEVIKTLKELIHKYSEGEIKTKAKFMLGEFLYKDGLLEDALEVYKGILGPPYISPLDDDTLLRIAEIHKEMGYNQLALETYDKIEKIYPFTELKGSIDFGRGEIFFGLKDYKNAILSYRKVEERFLIDKALFKIGLCYFESKEYDKAIESFRYLLEKVPMSHYKREAMYKIGESFYRKKDYHMGIKELQKFLDSDYDREYIQRTRFKIAWGYFMSLKYKKALQSFNDVIDLHSESELAYKSRYWRGIIFWKEKDYQNSNYEFNMISDHSSKTDFLDNVLWRTGNNYFLLKDYTKAIQNFKKSKKRFPDQKYFNIDEKIMEASLKASNYKEYLNVFLGDKGGFSLKDEFVRKTFQSGNELMSQGNFQESREVFEKIIKEPFVKKEVIHKGLFMIGESYYEEGKIEKAMEYFKGLLKKRVDRKTLSRIYFRIANILTQKGDIKGATNAYEKSFFSAINKKVKALSLYGVGDSYLKSGYLENALEIFAKLIKEFPKEESLIKEKINIGLIFQENNMHELAIISFRQVTEVSHDNSVKAEAQFWIGDTLQRQGKSYGAIEEYLKVAYVYKQDSMWGVTARFKAGEIYEKLKSYKEAMVLYKDIAERFKGEDRGAIASQKIENIEKILKER